jgi:hypothetical protein
MLTGRDWADVESMDPRDAIDPFEPWIPGSNQATPGHDQGGVVLTRLEPWP